MRERGNGKRHRRNPEKSPGMVNFLKKSEIGVTEGFFSSHVPESQFSSCVLSRNHPSP